MRRHRALDLSWAFVLLLFAASTANAAYDFAPFTRNVFGWAPDQFRLEVSAVDLSHVRFRVINDNTVAGFKSSFITDVVFADGLLLKNLATDGIIDAGSAGFGGGDVDFSLDTRLRDDFSFFNPYSSTLGISRYNYDGVYNSRSLQLGASFGYRF